MDDLARAARRPLDAAEDADLAMAREMAPLADTPLIRLLGWISEIADQPPLASLCVATIGVALLRRDARLGATGLRMLAAHAAATRIKSFIKHRVDRTRPNALGPGDDHHIRPGGSRDHDESSFPSGHTAGAVAVARALVRTYPSLAVPAAGTALAVALIQLPRRAHYLSDVAAGAVVGLAGEAMIDGLVRLAAPALRSLPPPPDAWNETQA